MISKRIKELLSRQAKSESPAPVNLRTPFQAWVVDLPAVWLIAALVIFVSFVYSGTGMFAFTVLMLNIFLGVPYLFLAAMFSKKPRYESQRAFSVLLIVSILGFAYCAHLDKVAPGSAQPVADAVDRFHLETGKYPETLDELTPKYLKTLPAVKPVFSPPVFKYELLPEGPSLSFDATGAFAHYQYDFGANKWIYLD